jgi:hypothetical protein
VSRSTRATLASTALLAALTGCTAVPASEIPPMPTTSDAPHTSASTASATPAPTPTRARVAATIPGTLYYFLTDTKGITVIHRLRGKVWTTVATAPNEYDVDISPDGRRIAWANQNTGALIVMNVDGSAKKTVDGGQTTRPQWSPGSGQLVYQRGTGTSDSIRIINADGSGGHQVGAAGFSPAWSADGAWIAYLSAESRPDPRRLTVVRADGTGARTVTVDQTTDWIYQLTNVSPGGLQTRAYTACKHIRGSAQGCDVGAPAHATGTTLVDTKTGKMTELTADQGEAESLLWTADGTTLTRIETSQAPTYALELRAADGTLLARQPEPSAARFAVLTTYVPQAP